MLEYVSLPEEYKSGIWEKKPPQSANGCLRGPFWESKEVCYVYFENGKFVYYKPTRPNYYVKPELVPESDEETSENDNVLQSVGFFIEPTPKTQEKEYTPIEVGMKGFFVIACEPGSGPQPFIVVHVDNEKETLGLIKPYVYIVNETNDDVELKVGCDMSVYQPEYGYEGINGSYDADAVKIISEKYKVYYQKNIIGKRWLGVDVGSFGNYGLPHSNEKGDEYEFIH